MTKTQVALLAALMLLCSCGGGPDTAGSSSSATSSGDTSSSAPMSSAPSPEDTKAATTISAYFEKTEKSGTSATAVSSLDPEEADCIGDGMVDKVGVDRLQETGVLTEDLKIKNNMNKLTMAEGEAGDTVDVLIDCTDVAALIQKEIDDDGPSPKKVQACLDKALTEENLRPAFVEAFQGDDAAAQKALGKPLAACAKLARDAR